MPSQSLASAAMANAPRGHPNANKYRSKMMKRTFGITATLLAALCGVVMLTAVAATRAQAASQQAPTRTFAIAGVSIDTVPFWLPSTITVHQGDRVRLVIKNMIGGAPDTHGFAIPAYNIAVLVPNGASKTVEFTADKAGIFPFICQIHANHIGGQIIVIPRGQSESKEK
jgi:nitrosocyanin